MTAYNEAAINQDDCKECNQVEIPADVKVPPIPDEELDAYKKIPQQKKQPIDDIRSNAHRDAEKTRADSKVDNKLTKEKARKIFETAQMIKESDTNKEKTRVEYKIKTYYDEYKKALLDASHAIPSLTDCGKSDDLPDYIKAVYITEFHKKIAVLTIEYQNKLKEIEKALFDATKTWNQAQSDFCNAECDACALEIKAKLEADFTWRTALKAEVDNACKA
ncbi:MAG: hypothetical protein LUQ26_10720 [Methylococcaceae bacterium]|nr:hypothetical protein [Methylococcaceae bacterium]